MEAIDKAFNFIVLASEALSQLPGVLRDLTGVGPTLVHTAVPNRFHISQALVLFLAGALSDGLNINTQEYGSHQACDNAAELRHFASLFSSSGCRDVLLIETVRQSQRKAWMPL